MAERASEEVRKNWKESILQQRKSGLSVGAWCRQNHIDVHRFRYWQYKFFSKPHLDRSSFKEISDHQRHVGPCEAGITLEYRGIYIHIGKQFDPSSLQQCIKALREIPC